MLKIEEMIRCGERTKAKIIHDNRAENDGRWDEETDVLIIGSGCAGLAAAIEAHNSGAKVKVIEKMDSLGGNSIINGGTMAVCCSKHQEMNGIKDSVDLMVKDMLDAGRYLNYVDKVVLIAECSMELWQWTVDYLGVDWNDNIEHFEGHSVPRTFRTCNESGSGIINPLVEKIRMNGIDIETRCKLEELVVNDSGRVNGVIVKKDYIFGDETSGRIENIKVNKAVIITSGGFGADVSMTRRYDPILMGNFGCTNHRGATGEVIRAAFKIGAEGIHLSWIELGPWASPDEEGFGCVSYYSVNNYPYSILVNSKTGKRFINELANRKTQVDAMMKIGKPAIQIIDYRNIKNYNLKHLEAGLKKGVIKEFENIYELALEYDIPIDSLIYEIHRYNAFVSTGEDTDFGRPMVDDAMPIQEAPFYACRLYPKVHHTMGGVKTDAMGRVINKNCNVINGLYAAGEAAGGTHGAGRLGSASLTECLVYGRLTGGLAVLEN